MLLRHAIGAVLRRMRLERGKTLRELSESSRISLPYLSEVERGRKEASSEILATLCRVLDVSERELLARVSAEYAAVGAAVLEFPRSVGAGFGASGDGVHARSVAPAHPETHTAQLLAA
ncbi:helix-turn-helix domain-containing protein [Leifsonia poae]|uniref:helix-turn-helix domain-containing protein n=1 Tax=Leifsonia poae TaxID=110933 RepID=UPI003D670360